MPRLVTARVIVMSFDLRLAVKDVAPSSRLGWQFNPIRARFGRRRVKDPNWSHPGKPRATPSLDLGDPGGGCTPPLLRWQLIAEID